MLLAGLEKVVDFQDVGYGRDYLDRLKSLQSRDRDARRRQHGASASPSRRRNTSPTPWPTTT